MVHVSKILADQSTVYAYRIIRVVSVTNELTTQIEHP
jgi:hypothetical protein